MRKAGTAILLVGVIAMALSGLAFAPIPLESVSALKVTRGKSFSVGAVFINGKYLPPPYIVERWGTGVRINREQVTGQVIEWAEFIKTQPNHKVVTHESPAEASSVEPAPAPEPLSEPEPEVSEVKEFDGPEDDLFADDTPEKKSAAVRKPIVIKPKPVAVKPKRMVTYELEGEFVPNDATKALVDRINGLRTEIDRALRVGNFICFGDGYPQVSGDSRTFMDLIEKLPELQKNAKDEREFISGARQAGLVYLNEDLLTDFYRNRVDYRKLQARRSRLKKDGEIQKVLDEVSKPLL